MRQVLLILSFIICHIPFSEAQEHHDWEDNHVLQINREPARAYFIPFGEQQACQLGGQRLRHTYLYFGRLSFQDRPSLCDEGA